MKRVDEKKIFVDFSFLKISNFKSEPLFLRKVHWAALKSTKVPRATCPILQCIFQKASGTQPPCQKVFVHCKYDNLFSKTAHLSFTNLMKRECRRRIQFIINLNLPDELSVFYFNQISLQIQAAWRGRLTIWRERATTTVRLKSTITRSTEVGQ